MRRKSSIVLDTSLYRRAKLKAARSGRRIADVFEAALNEHLRSSCVDKTQDSVVAATWQSLPAPRELVQVAVTEEEGLFDR